jgi:hypothetical protein
MSATIDLSEYFNSPNLSSDEVFAQEDRLAAVLEEAAGDWHASSGIAYTLREIADSSEYVSFLNPQFSTLTEEHPGVVLIGFGAVAIYIKYYHVQVRVLESTQEIHQHLAGFTAGVRTQAWRTLGEHMAYMATRY